MNRTQVEKLLGDVRATLGSFLSLVAVVALGLGAFLGVRWGAQALATSYDDTVEQGTFHDLEVQLPYGLTDDDLNQLVEVDGVEMLETGYSSFQQATFGADTLTIKVQSLTSSIDVPQLVEGSLPARYDEMALMASWARDHGVAVGDTITFAPDGDDEAMTYLVEPTYRVTALVEAPAYLAKDPATYGASGLGTGAIDGVAFVTTDAFRTEAYRNGIPNVYVRCLVPEGVSDFTTFSRDYQDTVDVVRDRVRQLGNTLASNRFESLHANAEQVVDQAQREVTDYEYLLADVHRQIAEQQQRMEEHEGAADELRRQIAQGETTLTDDRATYDRESAQAETGLADAKRQLDEAQTAYDSMKARLDESQALWDDMSRQRTTIEEAVEKLQEAVDRADVRIEAAEESRQAAGADATDALEAVINEQLDESAHEFAKTVVPLLRAHGFSVAEGLTYDHTDIRPFLQTVRVALDDWGSYEVNAGGEQIRLSQLGSQLGSYRTDLAEKELQLDVARQRYEQLQRQGADTASGTTGRFGTTEASLGEMRARLTAAEAELEAERQQLDAQRALAEERTDELADARLRLEEGERALSNLRSYSWVVLARSENGAAALTQSAVDATLGLGRAMLPLLLVAGLMACAAASMQVARVRKERGLAAGEVTTGCLVYVALAAGLGVLAGGLLAVCVAEALVGAALSTLYATGVYQPFVSVGQLLAVDVAVVALALLVALFACRLELRSAGAQEDAASLEDGATRSLGRRPAWWRLPQPWQAMMASCMSDVGRTLTVLAGAAVCTALVTAAVTLKANVAGSLSQQYEQVSLYDAVVTLDGGSTDAAQEAGEALAAQGVRSAAVYQRRLEVGTMDGATAQADLMVPTDLTSFSELCQLVGPDANPVDLGESGVWVSQGFGEDHDLAAGDVVTVLDATGERHELAVRGLFWHALPNVRLVMSPAAYALAFGAQPHANVLLADADVAQVSQTLADREDVLSVRDERERAHAAFGAMEGVVRVAAATYLLLAVAVAVMFVTRLAEDLDAAAATALVVLGIVVGMALGAAAGHVLVLAAEPHDALLVRAVSLRALCLGAVAGAAPAALGLLVGMRRR